MPSADSGGLLKPSLQDAYKPLPPLMEAETKLYADCKAVIQEAGGDIGDFLFEERMARRGYHAGQLWTLIQPLVDKGYLLRSQGTIKVRGRELLAQKSRSYKGGPLREPKL